MHNEMKTTYNPMPAARTPVRAWLAAVERLRANGDMMGLMLHIEEPTRFGAEEEAVVREVDRFLRGRGKQSVSTVANTIFPIGLDRGDGVEGISERYLAVYGRRIAKRGGWGRYFERMINWEDRKGNRINQLHENIDMLRKLNSEGSQFYGNCYEVAIFDPERDCKRRRGRQCLSMIEFKPSPNRSLHMTAFYRNHYYIQRTLGNLIGLGNLLRFIAREAGFETGSLTIVSTHAELDACGGGKKAVHSLIDSCAGMRVNLPAREDRSA